MKHFSQFNKPTPGPSQEGSLAERARKTVPLLGGARGGFIATWKAHFFTAALFTISLAIAAPAAEKYTGTCNVVFEGDSTLHGFTGDITNIAVIVLCDTNSAGVAILNTRLEIAPKQLTTHHAKRDKNMYAMFKADSFPKLIAVVTNAPLAAAKLIPTEAASTAGTLPVQLTFCGITKEVSAKTTNPKPVADGWEFDLQTDVSLKTFKLEPPSVMFGAISVADKVVIKAHVKVKRELAK